MASFAWSGPGCTSRRGVVAHLSPAYLVGRLVGRRVPVARGVSRLRVRAPGWAWHLVESATLRAGDDAGRLPSREELVALLAEVGVVGTLAGVTELPSSSGLAVAVLAVEDPARELVVKVALEPQAVAELRADASVRSRLSEDRRAGEWSRLLPHVVASSLDASPALSLEQRIAGIGGAALMVGAGPTWRRAYDSAAAAIVELHSGTSDHVRVDADRLRAWVDEPVAVLNGVFAAGSWQRVALRRLQEEISRSLTGRRVAVGWTHGDYSPGNLIFSPGGELAGVVDWGAGSPAGLLQVDTATLGLTTAMLRRRREFGDVVMGALQEAQPAPSGGVGRRPSAGPLSWREAVLLAWLRHVTLNLTKTQRYRRRDVWRAVNVDGVLSVVTQGA